MIHQEVTAGLTTDQIIAIVFGIATVLLELASIWQAHRLHRRTLCQSKMFKGFLASRKSFANTSNDRGR